MVFKKKNTPESLLKKAAVQLLKIHGIYNFPLVAAMGSPPGLPDRVAIRDGKFIAIEFKRPKSLTESGRMRNQGELTDDQIRVKEQIESAGGLYITCRSLDDLYEHLNLPGRLFP